jgi:WD40 repeat protein
VKCWKQPVPSLGLHYARVQEALDRAALECAVKFHFVEEGVRIGDERYPVLKMDWVEGLPLNRVAGDRADSPAVMNALFQLWVQLCREVRGAGIAHADLQHANVLLVPGAWPGAYTLKLIDYDGMFVPALAGAPLEEPGHPNYQHPARGTAGTYSINLDRFPHLVIATALKGLSVVGPPLWQRYDTGDNLLFTAADFQNPAGSALMQELWLTNDPALRALVGKLVLACGWPIAQTPWLDELVTVGLDSALSPSETRTVTDLLGSNTSVASPTAGNKVTTLAEAFTLDDEPKPAPPRAAPVSPRKQEPVLSLDADPEDEPRPRPRARARPRPEPQPARSFPVVLAVVAAGVLLLAAGVGVGLFIGGQTKSQESAQPQPQPKDPPPPSTPAAGAPQSAPQPEPQPQPQPPPAPVFQGPPGFHQVWSKVLPVEERAFVRPFIGADGRSVFVTMIKRVEVCDPKTGDVRAELRGPDLPVFTTSVWILDRDRVAAFGPQLKVPGLWNANTGEALPALTDRDPLPQPPPGGNATTIECQLSPDGKYLFAGYQGPLRGQSFGAAPYRVVEVATGKVLHQGDWTFGTARFTADGARMLMAETNGRVRWVKVPSGEIEIEWAFTPMNYPRQIASMTADGALFVYFGRPAGLPFDCYLMDGKTGQVLRKLGGIFNGERSALSADGKWLVGAVPDPSDFRNFVALVIDARTGESLVRMPVGAANDFPYASFTADGRAFVTYNRGKREVSVYELRGAVPEVAGARAPAPLSPIPPRAKPGEPVADLLPPPPPPVLPPMNVLPDAPPLKARWTVATETGIMSNGLPNIPLYSKDGRTVVLAGGVNGTVLTFDPKTGAAGTVYDGHKTPGGVQWLTPLGNDRVASGGFDNKHAIWDTKTGRRLDDLRFPELPPLPDGRAGHAGITSAVSPGGRYTVLARKEAGRPVIAGPLRVLDTSTGVVVLKADWNGGRIVFTADESRVLVLDGLGKATWYKLPFGEEDGGWTTGAGVVAERARILGSTADGRTVLYQGPLAGQPYGVYLLEGATGKVIRKLDGHPYQASFSALSPDGRFVAMAVIDFNRGPTWYADVFEVAQWRVVGRAAPPEKGSKEIPQLGFSPDGKDLAIFYPIAKELAVFPLPEGAAPR